MEQPHEHLYILWTTGDEWTAQFLVLQYAANSLLKDWWDEVTVILWGASAKLAAENEGVQTKMKIAAHAGVKFSACNASARQLGVTGELERLGVEVKGWGSALSRLIRQGAHILTV